MARKEATVVITKEGRDAGKRFLIREKEAWEIEAWSIQALQLLARSGAEMPDGIFDHGSKAFFVLGVGSIMSGLGKIPYYDVKPLLDEMNTCVVGFTAPGSSTMLSGYDLIRTQIEEASTMFTLRERIVDLHFSFSVRDYLSTYLTRIKGAMAALGGNLSTLSGDEDDQLQRQSLQDSAL